MRDDVIERGYQIGILHVVRVRRTGFAHLAVDDLLHLVDVRVEDEPVEETADIPDLGRAFHADRIGIEVRNALVGFVVIALAVETLHERLGDLLLQIGAVVGFEPDVIRLVAFAADGKREGEPVAGKFLGRVVAHVDIELRYGIAGAHPPLRTVVGMFRILGIGRAFLRIVLAILGEHHHSAVGLAEGVHQGAFGLQRVLHRIADLHIDDERTLGAQVELPLVAAVALHAVADDARGKVEPHPGAFAQQELGIDTLAGGIVRIEVQRIAHGQESALHQARILRAAVAVEGNVVGVFGERAELAGFIGTARKHDVAAQIAAREVELHPAGSVVHRLGVGIPGSEDFDVIAAFGLVIFQQLPAVLRHPRLKGLVLEFVIRLGLLLGAGCQQHDAGCREVEKTGDQLHILLYNSINSVFCLFVVLHAFDREKPRDGAFSRNRAHIFVPVSHIVGHVGFDDVAFATTK